MRNRLVLILIFIVSTQYADAKAHLVTFGAWMQVQLFVGPDADRVKDMRVRALLVDGHTREYLVGEAHDVTDRTFVVRRVFRMNDSLTSGRPQWKWQRGGWIMVDRTSGRISKINLTDFDPFYSVVSWFRDYAAYCGVNDGQKLYAIVSQIGERRPVLRSYIGPALDKDEPDSQCDAPIWQKQPLRVSFAPKQGQKLSFSIHGRSGEAEPSEEAEQKESSKR
jgi:hypothetical protein